MARVSNWNPQKYDREFIAASMDRLEACAEIVAAKARAKFPLRKPPPPEAGRKSKKEWVPMSKGDLLKSIRVKRLKDDPKRNVRVYAGGRWKGAPFYAGMIEYGTKKMGARPFLRPALNSSKNEIRNVLGGV
jgi:HK97 gp10 family phage protein